jgi:hypothetical protein
VIGFCGRFCYCWRMESSVAHSREEETIEAKARWFQSLPLAERMEMLVDFTDLALEVNPHLADAKDAQPAHSAVRIVPEG